MDRVFPRRAAAALAAFICAGGLGADAAADGRPVSGPQARAEAPGPAANEADIQFMAGMIPHHAQAVLIAGWAPTHGARKDVRILCERIVVGQKDEIALMQTWLSDRGQPVPDANATHHTMKMGDMEHKMLMPGMLTEAELAQLNKARGPEFDRLFLMFMIKHHEGALTMVDELFESHGAAQGDLVFTLASDIWADQIAEIERMQQMLAAGGK